MSIDITPLVSSVTLSNGVRLEYVEQGDPMGTPVICLHGSTDSWRSFEPVLPYLPPSLRVIALTQRGHGDSDRPAAGYHLRDFAADVAAFLDAVGIESAVIVGHSMGSMVAQRFAMDFSARANAIVLMSSFVSFHATPELAEFCALAARLEDPIDPEFVRRFQADTLAQPIAPSFFELVCAESMKLPAFVWQESFSALLDDENARELERISAPTLIVWGDRDALSARSEQDALLARIPNARRQIYGETGHALHWEQPSRFAADLVTFIQAVAG